MKLRSTFLLVMAALGVALGQPMLAQSEDSRGKEIEELREQLNVLREEQLRMRQDIEQIKTLLKRQDQATQRDPYRGKTVSTEPGAVKGQETAKVTLVEFSDFQCPYCAKYVRETLPRLEEEYISTGRVKYVFRNLPLERIHKSAFHAAEAASCAGEQGQFWPMHDAIFANNRNLSEDFTALARQLDLNLEAFHACLSVGKFKADVRKDIQDAGQLTIGGTPTFLIGLTRPGQKEITVIRSFRGAVRFEQLKQALDAVLEIRQQQVSAK